jgi:hypothetical protein
VANDAITDHALILQKAINMEEAAASAKESKSGFGSQQQQQQQAACLVSTSSLVAKPGQCDYCGIFDHEARACKKRLADEKGSIFRPRHPDWPMTKKSWNKEGGQDKPAQKKKKPKGANAVSTSAQPSQPPQQGAPTAPPPPPLDAAAMEKFQAYFAEKYQDMHAAAMAQPPPSAANAVWQSQFPALMGPQGPPAHTPAFTGWPEPPAKPAFPGWPAPGNY